MYDLILTLVVVYLGYRGYSWYANMQEQVKSGQQPPHQVGNDQPTDHRPKDDDYIDYEEVD
jgi:hypothetical protein